MAVKKKSVSKKSLGLGSVLAGATAAAAAGAYYLYGPSGKKHRRKLRSWSVKAKKEVLQNVRKLDDVKTKDYYALVEKAARKYGRLKEVNGKEIAEFKRELRAHWKILQRKTKKGIKSGKRRIHKATAPKKATRKIRTTKRRPSTKRKGAKKRR